MSSENALHNTGEASAETPEPTSPGETVLSVRDLGKCYTIYDYPKDKLKEVLTLDRITLHRKFWALKGLTFDVPKGQTVGIVGRNGSGKSTLLQIICGTLAPSVGTVTVRGRISAVLELGSGFNPEFTGRENVYLNASILGLSGDDIDSRFDSIVEFADIGDFVDQPVRMYSSGMQIRLAFSVAVNVDPDILVVDEALAVGDEMFQRKCYSRMHQIRQRGATILFVSHSPHAILDLCERAFLLDRGELLLDGPPKLVVSRYQQLIFARKESQARIRNQLLALDTSADSGVLPGEGKIGELHQAGQTSGVAYYDPSLVPKSTLCYDSRGAVISDPHICTPEGMRVNNLLRGDEYVFAYVVDFSETVYSVRTAMLIKTLRGMELGGALSSTIADAVDVIAPGTRLNVQFKFSCLLAPGTYFLNAGVEGLVSGTRTYLDRRVDAVAFRVLPEREPLNTAVVDFRIEPRMDYEQWGSAIGGRHEHR